MSRMKNDKKNAECIFVPVPVPVRHPRAASDIVAEKKKDKNIQMTNKKSLNKANGPNSAFAFAEEPKENQMMRWKHFWSWDEEQVGTARRYD